MGELDRQVWITWLRIGTTRESQTLTSVSVDTGIVVQVDSQSQEDNVHERSWTLHGLGPILKRRVESAIQQTVTFDKDIETLGGNGDSTVKSALNSTAQRCDNLAREHGMSRWNSRHQVPNYGHTYYKIFSTSHNCRYHCGHTKSISSIARCGLLPRSSTVLRRPASIRTTPRFWPTKPTDCDASGSMR